MKDIEVDEDREIETKANNRMTNILKKMYSPRNFAAPPELEMELNSKAALRSGCLTERGMETARTGRTDNLMLLASQESGSAYNLSSRKAETQGKHRVSNTEI
jgi:hypothetical protein